MRGHKIYYKKLFSLGNYENVEIGIELTVDDGEKAQDVLENAKLFIELNDPRSNSIKKINEAVKLMAQQADLPF